MRAFCIVMLCGLSGCATRAPHGATPPVSVVHSENTPEHGDADSVIVTRYELGSYRYPKDRSGKEVTAVYRRTRVSPAVAAKAGVPGTTGEPVNEYVPASFAPLPPSAELAAELTSQKRITEELQGIKASMVAMEQQARAQYDALVRRTEEAVRAHQQLEAQVARVRALEAQLRERLQNSPQPVSSTSPAPAAAPDEEPQW